MTPAKRKESGRGAGLVAVQELGWPAGGVDMLGALPQ